MFYMTCRLHSTGEYSVEHDPVLWKELVTQIEELHEYASTWRIRLITNVSSADEMRFLTYDRSRQWQQPEMVAETATCYLRVESFPQDTTFTIVSLSQEGLESLAAILENLYDPVTSASLDNFLSTNENLFVRRIEMLHQFNRNEIQNTYGTPLLWKNLRDDIPFQEWSLLSLSAILQINDPLPVSLVHLRMQANQAWFDVQGEVSNINNLFVLAEIAFKDDTSALRGIYRPQ